MVKIIEPDELTFEQVFAKVGLMGSYSAINNKADNEFLNQPFQSISMAPWWYDWMHHGWDTGLELLLDGEPMVLRRIFGTTALFTIKE